MKAAISMSTHHRALSGFAAAAALSIIICASGAGQGRNPGRGGGGGDSQPQRSNPSPSPSQPNRSDPAPQRSEPRREETRREAPRYESQRPEPRVEYQRRSDPTPSREANTLPNRAPGGSGSYQDRRSGREASPIPRQEPSARRDEPRSPARDSNPSPRGNDSGSVRDGWNRNGDQRPQRDSGNTGGGGPGYIYDRRNGNNTYDRVGDRRTADQGPRRDSTGSRDSWAGPIRTGNSDQRSRRGENVSPERDRARDLFTRSQEGRYYNNGVLLRRGYYTPYREVGHYYPNYVYYPYYYPRYDASIVYFSPYSFYYGVCAPYIYRRHAYYAYPSSIWIDIPIYTGSEYRGWADDRRGDDYYLSRSGYYDPEAVSDTALRDAVDDIRDAFRYGSIEHLVNLVDPQVKIAVFRNGKYEYSMFSNDYLDLTRDAMRAMDTIQFDVTRLRKRAMEVYVASGKHVYKDAEGAQRTVYVSFVLEKLRDRWTITQIGTSPDRIQEP